MNEREVEWRIDAANYRTIRLLIYGWIGLLGGGSLLILGLILLFAAGAVAGGEYAIAALMLLLLLVGGPFSVLYLWIALRSGSFTPFSRFVLDTASEPAEPLAERYARVFSWRDVGIAITIHAIGIPVLLQLDPRILGVYIAIWFGLLIVLSGFVTWGRIDTRHPSFEYRSGTIPLAAIKRVRRKQIGGIVLCWISYHPGTKSITTPSWVVLTPKAARAFDAARAAVRQQTESESSRRLPKYVALGVGAGLITLAVGLTAFSEISPGIALYVGLLLGVIGVFIIWVGLTSI